MKFGTIVTFDCNYATSELYKRLEVELQHFAKISKRGNPANIFVGEIEASDISAATSRLQILITKAFNEIEVTGTVRFWVAESFMEESFVI